MLLRTVTVAHATLDAIDAAINADGGAAFRVLEGELFPKAGDAYRGADDDGARTHLGASLLGRECAREIWYRWRWAGAGRGATEPRMLRLYNRGHLEEPRFIAMLKMIGCEVWTQDENGDQFRITWAGGHAGGSGDGVARGIPELPATTAACAEFKTHGEKSFIKLAGKLDDWRAHRKDPTRIPFPGEGLRLSKLEHFTQMQLYMRKMGLAAGLYMAVNKNTDDLYAELITLDVEYADQFLNRGEQLVYLREPPKKLNESPGFWKCRFCDEHAVCHGGRAPAPNCRTCVRSEVHTDGTWRCGRTGVVLDKEAQLRGCGDYERLF